LISSPDPATLDPLVEIWERGRPWYRCHSVIFGATEPNPGKGGGRFHPFVGSDGRPVPTLYGADTLDGALSETVFHGVPVRGEERSIRASSLRPIVVSKLAARRDLALAQLHGHGLRRLRVERSELIDCDADGYAGTVLWAQALHRSAAAFDGLVWISRLHDTSRALVLFGDRVRREELTVEEPPLPLAVGPGYGEVLRIADQAGIMVVE
jgi:hypothetical protein